MSKKKQKSYNDGIEDSLKQIELAIKLINKEESSLGFFSRAFDSTSNYLRVASMALETVKLDVKRLKE